ncbi:hypothetical protein, conserved [Babesia ovata]|uniref:SWIM-type domain-containing protein n=1 Tax=Babesia ovata TaxID=189622 RepID=A0A2H6KI22_9APIC|nr:uncharacterized protein BOVATA_041280 [Babesia ovata]GBE62635.1 hypothetical protein, conserved [Babesia ovata]
MVDNPFVQAWPSRSDGSYRASLSSQRPSRKPAAAFSAGLQKASDASTAPPVHVDVGSAPLLPESNETLSPSCSETSAAEASLPDILASQSSEPAKNAETLSQKGSIEDNVPVSATDKEDSSWLKCMEKFGGFSKALGISQMVGGVYAHSYTDYYVVHSHSENCRMVDMLFFNCNCPKVTFPCSHIMAAALSNNDRRYVGKVVLIKKIEQQVMKMLHKSKRKNCPASIVSAIAENVKNLCTDAQAEKMLLELLLGIVFRLIQVAYGLMPYNVDLMGRSKSRYLYQVGHSHAKEHMGAFDQTPMPYTVPENSQAFQKSNNSVPGINVAANDECRCACESNTRLEMYARRLVRRFRFLLGSIAPLPKPSNEQDVGDAVKSMMPAFRRMLEEDYGIDVTSEKDQDGLEETISHYLETHDSAQVSPTVDGYALGYDYAERQKPPAETVDDPKSVHKMQELYDEIAASPMMADIHRVTNWSMRHQINHGTLKGVLENCSPDVLGDVTFITLKNDSAIKVPSTKGFASSSDILQKMISAIHKNDSRSFAAHGLTLLVSVKKISLLPSRDKLTEAINQMLSSHSPGEPGPLFLAKCIDLMPDMLLLPFCTAYFDNTDVFSKKCMRRVAIHMCELILKGGMNGSVYDKIILMGSFFNIPVSVYWEEAKAIVARRYKGWEEASGSQNVQHAEDSKSSQPENECSHTSLPIAEPTALPTPDHTNAVVSSKIQQSSAVSGICAAPMAATAKGSDPNGDPEDKQELLNANTPANRNVGKPCNNAADNKQNSGYIPSDHVDKSSSMKFSPTQEGRHGDPVVEKTRDTANDSIDTVCERKKRLHEGEDDSTPPSPEIVGKSGDTSPDVVNLYWQLWAPTDPELLARGEKLINDIRYEEFGVSVNPNPSDSVTQQNPETENLATVLRKQRQRIARSIGRLSEDLYNSRVHFQQELLQNADDNDYDVKSPEVAFLFDNEGIVVINNERGFSEKDVRSLCDVGASSKIDSSESKVGKFGRGFKSVFLVTQSPFVFSNGYHFMFNANPDMVNNTEFILPHWVCVGNYTNPFGYVKNRLSTQGGNLFRELASQLVQRHGVIPNTLMYLPFKKGDIANGRHTCFSDFQKIDALYLAFLRKLTAITLVDGTESTATRFIKKTVSYKTATVTVSSKSKSKTADSSTTTVPGDSEYVTKSCFQVITISKEVGNLFDGASTVEDLCVFLFTYNFQLDSTERIAVGLSEEVNEDYAVTVGVPVLPNVVGGKTYSVCNGLPVADYGLPFLIDANFVVSASRGTIISDDPWNSILAEHAGLAFALMIFVISKAYRNEANLYRNVIYAIPGKDAGTGVFEKCCARAQEVLKQARWVAVDGESNVTVLPSQAIIPPDDTCLVSKKDTPEILRAVFHSELLKDYCDMYYAAEEFHDPYLRGAMLNVGISEMNVAFICQLLKGLRTKIDISLPLSSQPQLAQQFFGNMGVVLCLLERMALPSDMDDIRKELLLVDSQGMLISVDDSTVFVRSGKHTCMNDIHKVISPSLFDNCWEIEGYEHRVAGILELLGCVELTDKNLLSRQITTKVRKMLDAKDRLGPDEILEDSRDVLHLLALNCGKLSLLGPKDIEVIRSMPVVLSTGKITHLGDPFIRFCPNHRSACKIMSANDDLAKHYSNIRTFATRTDLHHIFLSDDYLAGIAKHSESSEAGFTFQDFVDTLAYIGVFSFITYAPLDLSVDASGKYELPMLPDDIKTAVWHRTKQLDSDLRRSHLLGIHKVVKDWYSPDFASVVDAVRKLYGSDPSNARGGDPSKHKRDDSALRLQWTSAHHVSTLLYHIMNKELELHPKYYLATLQFGGRQQPLGHSLLYYQLRHIPWLPYKECVYKHGSKSRPVGTWQAVPPIALENDIGYPCTLFLSLDEQVRNELLLPKESYDLLEILNFISAKCGQANLETPSRISTQTGTNQGLQHWGDPSTLERLNHSFSQRFFDSILLNQPAVLRRILACIYIEVYREMQKDSLFAVRARTMFWCRELIVSFGPCVNSLRSPQKPVVCTAQDPRLVVFKSMTGCEVLTPLADDYAEFPLLGVFWYNLGIKEFMSAAETLRILGNITEENALENLEIVYMCIIHLYNVLDEEEFTEALWERKCIPVTCEYDDMFIPGQDDNRRTTKMDRLVAPASGIVVARDPDSVDLLQNFSLGPQLGIWVAGKPLIGPLDAYMIRYFQAYPPGTDVRITGIWVDILDTLEATEFKEYCWMEPVVGAEAEQCPWPMGVYVLVALLPYVHYYLKHRMKDQYSLCCKRFPQILSRISIVITTGELLMEYRYRKGGVSATGTRVSDDSFIHCDSAGTIKIYAVLSAMPKRFNSTADVISSAQEATKLGYLKGLPESFFVNLAKSLLSDPTTPPMDLNSRFVGTTEQETLLGEFMSAIYEMIMTQPKNAVDTFMKRYSTGPSGRCLCSEYVFPSLYQLPGNSSAIAPGRNTSSGDVCAKAASDANVDTTMKKSEVVNQTAAKGTSGGVPAKNLPYLEGHGSHLDSGEVCLGNVMDPFVYILLYGSPIGQSAIESTSSSNESCDVESIASSPSTSANVELPDADHQGVSRSSEPVNGDSSSSSESTPAHVDVVDKSVQSDSAGIEATPSDNTADDLTHLLRSAICPPHAEPRDEKRDDGDAVKSLPPTSRHEDVTLNPAPESVRSPLQVEEDVASISQQDAINDHGAQVQLYHGRSTSCKDVHKHLAYMLVLSDELRSAVGSVSLYEHIPSSKYVKPTKMNRQLADRTSRKNVADSQRSYAVGYLGEEYVFELLQALLKSELDSKKVAISWYNKTAESGLAYDLTIHNTEGEEVFIEVKSSSSSDRNYFPVSYNEWCFAQQKGARMVTIKGDHFRFDTIAIQRAGASPPKYDTFRVPVPLETELVMPEEGAFSSTTESSIGQAEPQTHNDTEKVSVVQPVVMEQVAVTVRPAFNDFIRGHLRELEKRMDVRMSLTPRGNDHCLIASGSRASEAIVEMLNMCRTSRIYNYYLCLPVRGADFQRVFSQFKQEAKDILGQDLAFEQRPHVTLALLNLVTDEDVDAVVRALQATTLAVSSLSTDADGVRKPYTIELAGVKPIVYKGRAAQRSVFMTHARPEDNLSDIASEFQESVKRAVNSIITTSKKRVAQEMASKAKSTNNPGRWTEAEAAARGIYITPGGNVEITYADVAIVDPHGAVTDEELNDMLAELRSKYIDHEPAKRGKGKGNLSDQIKQKHSVDPSSKRQGNSSNVVPRDASETTEENVDTTHPATVGEVDQDFPEYETSVSHEFHVTLLRNSKVERLQKLGFKTRGDVCCVELRPRGGETCNFKAYTKTRLVQFVGNRYDGKPSQIDGASHITGSAQPELPSDLLTDPGASEGGSTERFVFWI